MGANAEAHAWQSQPVHKEGFCYALGVVELPVGKGQGLHSTLLRDAPVQGTGSIGLGFASNTAYVSSGSTARTRAKDRAFCKSTQYTKRPYLAEGQ